MTIVLILAIIIFERELFCGEKNFLKMGMFDDEINTLTLNMDV